MKAKKRKRKRAKKSSRRQETVVRDMNPLVLGFAGDEKLGTADVRRQFGADGRLRAVRF